MPPDRTKGKGARPRAVCRRSAGRAGNCDGGDAVTTRHAGWVLLGWLAATGCEAAAPPARPLRDAYGDPLPDGAAARLGTLRWRAGMFIAGFAWSPDGKWIATADAHGRTVRLWEASSGRV